MRSAHPIILSRREGPLFLQKELFMKLIKGSFAGLVLAGVLATMPMAAFAQGSARGHRSIVHSSHANFLMSGRAVAPQVQSSSDDGFYHPPRDPQFNTARDQ